jgi:hypothetical protein
MNTPITFEMYGKSWIHATPRPSLMTSNTISDALEKNSIFAVCLETGELTIFSAKKLKENGLYERFYPTVRTVTLYVKKNKDAVTRLYEIDVNNLDQIIFTCKLIAWNPEVKPDTGFLAWVEEQLPAGFTYRSTRQNLEDGLCTLIKRAIY